MGSALVALRSDMSDFLGWVVTMQEGIEDTNSGEVKNVTISGVELDLSVKLKLLIIGEWMRPRVPSLEVPLTET